MTIDSIKIRTPEALLDPNLEFANSERTIAEITLTRDRCINPSLVDSFLRLLRHGSDDIIRQRIYDYTKKSKSRGPLNEKCHQFVKNELYPNWEARTKIIDFCDQQAKQMKDMLDEEYGSETGNDLKPLVDARLDPYAARDRVKLLQSKYMQWRSVNQWVENNRTIESILQSTSERILKDKCDQNIEYLHDFFSQMNGKKE